MVTIKYNNINPFDGISRTPLLARREEIIQTNRRLARADVFTLSGKIKRQTCTDGFESIYNLTKALIVNFSDNFKKFEVIENGNTIYSYNQAQVVNISFDEDKYFDLVPFTITLRCYKDSYAELYGVLDPTDDYSFDEGDGCLVNITHTVSAKGLNNSLSSMTNVRNFVSSRSGWQCPFSPVGYEVSGTPVLTGVNENINRFSGEVTVTESYVYDKSGLSGTSEIIQRTTTDFSINDGIANIVVSGTYQGDINDNVEITRSSIQLSSAYYFALAEYLLYNPTGTLNQLPVSSSFTENRSENTISYSFTFNDNPNTDPYVIDKTTITINEGLDCITCDLSIQSDFGCPAERLRKTKAYYESLDLHSYVDTKWDTYGSGKLLGSAPTNQTVGFDHLTGTVTVSLTYCSNNSESCGCLENFKYSLSFVDPIPQFVEEASYEGEGCYAIQDLNYINRATFSIQGSARPAKCCDPSVVKSQVASRANQIMAEFFTATDIILDSCSIDIASDNSVVGFSFSWNGIKAVQVSDAIIYGTIDDDDFVYSLLLADGDDLLLASGDRILLA